MEPEEASKLVQTMARERAHYTPLTVRAAIAKAESIAMHPAEYLVEPAHAKEIIATLLKALKASPCYLKAVNEEIPSFTLLAYDRAGHGALRVWISLAELNGCRAEKIADARARLYQWERRPDLRWPG